MVVPSHHTIASGSSHLRWEKFDEFVSLPSIDLHQISSLSICCPLSSSRGQRSPQKKIKKKNRINNQTPSFHSNPRRSHSLEHGTVPYNVGKHTSLVFHPDLNPPPSTSPRSPQSPRRHPSR